MHVRHRRTLLATFSIRRGKLNFAVKPKIDESACSVLLRVQQAVQTDTIRRPLGNVRPFGAGLPAQVLEDERDRFRSMHVLQLQVTIYVSTDLTISLTFI